MNALQRDLKKLVPLVESLGAEKAASDPHRQKFHIQPMVGWLNDPNGLCKIGDTYHAFFQYGPFDVNGGVKHWGHVTSRDLLHWDYQPTMLYPDEPFDCHGVYSGSALVEDGTMYLYYTGNVKYPGAFDYIKQGRGHNVCLAVSRDGLHIDSKQCLMYNKDYPAGLTCHVRDPKVFACEGRYYMVLGARTVEDRGEVLVLESEDKYTWPAHQHADHTRALRLYVGVPGFVPAGRPVVPGRVPPRHRVPERLRLRILPDLRRLAQVTASLGDFYHADFGFDYYAPQSFTDETGRRIQIGWMGMPDAAYGNAATVAYGWQHCMTISRVLTRDNDRAHPAKPGVRAGRPAAATAVTCHRRCRAGSVDACFDLVAAPGGDLLSWWL